LGGAKYIDFKRATVFDTASRAQKRQDTLEIWGLSNRASFDALKKVLSLKLFKCVN